MNSGELFAICLRRSRIGASRRIKALLDSFGLKRIYTVKFLQTSPDKKTKHLLDGYCITGPILKRIYQKMLSNKLAHSQKYRRQRAREPSKWISILRMTPPRGGLKHRRLTTKYISEFLLKLIYEKKN